MGVLYLLDANVLIDAHRDYYPIERVPEFWEWLSEMGELGRIKAPQEIYEEVVLPKPSRPDRLLKWLEEHRDALVLSEQAEVAVVSNVTAAGYADDLTDEEIERVGRDPFLIAYALAEVQNRCVVTTERSKPTRVRANRHIPDVCNDLSVRWCDTFALIRELDFRTDWRTGAQ